jgi:hypothetical protein
MTPSLSPAQAAERAERAERQRQQQADAQEREREQRETADRIEQAQHGGGKTTRGRVRPAADPTRLSASLSCRLADSAGLLLSGESAKRGGEGGRAGPTTRTR